MRKFCIGWWLLVLVTACSACPDAADADPPDAATTISTTDAGSNRADAGELVPVDGGNTSDPPFDAGHNVFDAGRGADDGGAGEPEPANDGGPGEPEAEPDVAVDSGPGEPEAEPTASPDGGIEPEPAVSLDVEVLTYNVAGLPFGLSSSDPEVNNPQISPLLNAYDLVLVQEDFGYHEELSGAVTLPHASVPFDTSGLGNSIGDGLNRFSRSVLVDHERVEWQECSGFVSGANDCLTSKGFSVARHTLAPGVEVDVYNAHFDAGRDESDHDARDAQVAQLVAFINMYSNERAVILAGDTNMKDEDEDTFIAMLSGAGLTDACRALDCSDIFLIDRVMFRSAAGLTLSASAWSVETQFVDAAGEPLSDHDAIRTMLHLSTGASTP